MTHHKFDRSHGNIDSISDLLAGVTDDVERLGQVGDVPLEAALEDHAVQPGCVPRDLHGLLEESFHLTRFYFTILITITIMI